MADEKRQVHSHPTSFHVPSRKRIVLRLAVIGAALVLYSLSLLNSQTSTYIWSFVSGASHGDGLPGTVTWWPCGDGVDCGTMIVPKDYFNASAGTATIALGRRRARKLPKRGSVMTNPGGPGIGGSFMAIRAGHYLAELVGDDWDIIGFDPRGTGQTTPKVQCFPDRLAQHLFLSNTLFELGITVPNIGNLSDPRNHAMLAKQQSQFLALKQAQAERCKEHMDVEDLRYMGTATVVRDMDFMTQVLEGKGAKINFWSGSYGSILGAYLVNMLPHRVGYVSIDGIADPVSWANEPSHKWHKGWVSSAETTYQMFLKACSEAGPQPCPLAKRKNEPPADIENRIETFIQSLVDSPLPVSSGIRPGYLTSGAARATLFMALESPMSGWPLVSHGLAEAMGPSANGTILLSMLLKPVTVPPGNSGSDDLARLAVTCVDSPADTHPTADELADENIAALRISKHFGVSSLITEPDGGCQFWPASGRGPERFTGPWNASLERPMLIVSNTGDPITPIASGLLVNSLMPNSSTLIIQNGPGHTSGSVSSLCTVKLYKEYWSGNTPKNGTVCELSDHVFEDPAGEKAISTMSAEDQALMRSWKELSMALLGARRPHLGSLLRD